MAAPTVSDWVTQWQWSWVGVLVALLLGGGYLAAWWRARRVAGAAPAGPLVAMALTLVLVLYLTCGPVGVFSTVYLWMFALRVALLSAVVPLGLALSRPVDVLAAGSRADDPRRWVKGRFARALMYPAVSSVLSAVSVLAVFFTGYGKAAATNGVVDLVMVVHLLLVGSLVVLPLLTEDMLPAWATPGVRTLIAALDGLLDALPGILVMTSSSLLMPTFPGFEHASRSGFSPQLDQKFAGGALLAVAEAIGIPMLVAVFVEWMRQDERSAKEEDRRLDALADEGELMTPWWVQGTDGVDDPGSDGRGH